MYFHGNSMWFTYSQNCFELYYTRFFMPRLRSIHLVTYWSVRLGLRICKNYETSMNFFTF